MANISITSGVDTGPKVTHPHRAIPVDRVRGRGVERGPYQKEVESFSGVNSTAGKGGAKNRRSFAVLGKGPGE